MPSGNPTGRTDFVLAFQNRSLFRLIGSISPRFELSRACKVHRPVDEVSLPDVREWSSPWSGSR